MPKLSLSPLASAIAKLLRDFVGHQGQQARAASRVGVFAFAIMAFATHSVQADPGKGYCKSYYDKQSLTVTICRSDSGRWFARFSSGGRHQFGSGFTWSEVKQRTGIVRPKSGSRWTF